ncbi:MAG: MGMT family protein [Candidatus Methanomethylicia archaeon]
MKYSSLKEAVYAILLMVPAGKVITYGALARAFNVSPKLIGKIMRDNENAPIIPCHRVVKSNGEIGGYSMGIKIKEKLLKLEGVKFDGGKIKSEYVIQNIDDLFK